MSAGLFEIRFRRAPVTPSEELPSAPLVEPAPLRHAAERGLHRYCSGCAQETEHVLCQGDDGPGIPAIRWPAAKPASGTTMCVDCGQWRVAASKPIAPTWSFWPRLPAETGAKPESRASVQAGPLESAAENEGMPPLRTPTRLRPGQPARTMKNPIATY
jgi:hypothetical protein